MSQVDDTRPPQRWISLTCAVVVGVVWIVILGVALLNLDQAPGRMLVDHWPIYLVCAVALGAALWVGDWNQNRRGGPRG